MHENLTITDGVYGVLSEIDVLEQITILGKTAVDNKANELEQLKSLTKLLLERLG